MFKNDKTISWFYIPGATAPLRMMMTETDIERTLSESNISASKYDFQTLHGLSDSTKANGNY